MFSSKSRTWCDKAFNIAPGERIPAALGFALFLSVFAGYFMLRPVRETMGIAGGVDNLPWLFSATFAATLLFLPIFGWIASVVPKRRILQWAYVLFAATLLGFAVLTNVWPDSEWVARVFYVWLSVYNMVAISLAWSVLADVFSVDQAKRLFALIAAGASAGGLIGPLVGVAFVGLIGHGGLMGCAAGLLVVGIATSRALYRCRDMGTGLDRSGGSDRRAMGGSAWAGATAVMRSPYLLMVCVFVLLLTSVNTFLYFDQARLVEETFPDRTQQTQVFGAIDAIVQALAIVTQVFFTGRIAQRLGIAVLLVAVPLIVAGGFAVLAVAPGFWVFALVMIVRRAGEYALVRPGREMLFTVMSDEDKYKAKSFIDSTVYRLGDVVSAWAKMGVDAVAAHPAAAACAGCVVALAWGGSGIFLARQRQRVFVTNQVRDSVPCGGSAIG